MVCLGVRDAHSQETAEPKSQVTQSPRLDVLRAPPPLLQGETTLPDALYLRNEDGTPIFVPRVRYEEFERFLKERSGAKQLDVPAALLESVRVTGAIQEGYADLSIELSMTITDPTAKMVRLALGLQNLNWVHPPKTTGGHTNLIIQEPPDSGVTWFVVPDGSEKYTVQLSAVAKVDQSISASTLRLDLPESSTWITLQIPGVGFKAQWIGATGEVLKTSAKNGATEADVHGRGGIGTLVWFDQASANDLGAIEIDSITRIVRSLDGKEYRGTTRLRIVSDTRLGPRELTVRLPDRARWVPASNGSTTSNWTLNRSEAIDDVRSPNTATSSPNLESRQSLRLRLSDRGRNLVEEIPIEWIMPVDETSNTNFSMAGVEVEGVQRHEGHMSVVLPIATRFTWLNSSEYVLSQQIPANDFVDATEYDFRFMRQPVRINGVIAEEKTPDHGRPEYLVRFDADEIRLDGVLTFPNGFNQLIGLEIHGGPWILDTATWDKSGELVETELIDSHTLRIVAPSPTSGDPNSTQELITSNGQLTIRYSAVQPLPTADGARINLPLPRIGMLIDGKRRIERGDGTLVIDHRNWQINPSEVRVSGMVKTSELPNSLRPILTTTPINELQIFRFQSAGPEAKWTGRVKRMPRVVSTTIDTQISIQKDQWKSTRKWSIKTKGPNIDRLPIQVPATWVTGDVGLGGDVVSDNILIATEGERCPIRVIEKDKNGWVTIEPVREVWPSSFDLEISYVENIAPMPNDPSSHSDRGYRSLAIPFPSLALQSPALIYSTNSTIEVGPQIVCQIPQSANQPLKITHQDGPQRFQLGERTNKLIVEIAPIVPIRESHIDIDRLWLQSMVNDHQRRERCVMVLSSTQPSISIELPASWKPESTTVMIDGRKTSLDEDGDNDRFSLMLPSKKSVAETARPDFELPKNVSIVSDVAANALQAQSFVIEFWNWEPIAVDWSTTLDAAIPSIVGVGGPAPIVWQIVLPADEHLWSSSSTLLSDQRWVWRNLGWRRASSFSQTQAEKEFGASVQPSIAAQTNQYVFHSIAGDDSQSTASFGQIRIIPRYVLWLPVALIVLGLTALWPKMGVLRHPWMMLLVVVALSLLAMSAPDMTIILIQSALVSMLVVALVKVLTWASMRRVYRRSIFKGRTSPTVLARPNVRSNTENFSDSQPITHASPESPSVHSKVGLDNLTPLQLPESRS